MDTLRARHLRPSRARASDERSAWWNRCSQSERWIVVANARRCQGRKGTRDLPTMIDRVSELRPHVTVDDVRPVDEHDYLGLPRGVDTVDARLVVPMTAGGLMSSRMARGMPVRARSLID